MRHIRGVQQVAKSTRQLTVKRPPPITASRVRPMATTMMMTPTLYAPAPFILDHISPRCCSLKRVVLRMCLHRCSASMGWSKHTQHDGQLVSVGATQHQTRQRTESQGQQRHGRIAKPHNASFESFCLFYWFMFLPGCCIHPPDTAFKSRGLLQQRMACFAPWQPLCNQGLGCMCMHTTTASLTCSLGQSAHLPSSPAPQWRCRATL